ncbi:MAG TPA: hypothetical protein VGR28_01555 [Candidatus Thermoplasmatota archaeon]|jgi:hypothetical protein|nr:hypothetical protein [Candidatus Thermoplasmatota archaeon]
MAPTRQELAALAMVAFLVGAAVPGVLARFPGADGADAWLPGPGRCDARAPLRLCTDRSSYARGAVVDAALENLGDAPMAGRLRAFVRDGHGHVVEQLAEADLILAPSVRLHLDWHPHAPPGRYAVGAWFAGRLLEQPLVLEGAGATRL